MDRFAVVPTRGNRPEVLQQCVDAIAPQVKDLLIVDNSDDGLVRETVKGSFAAKIHPSVAFRHIQLQPVNLSKLWNVGLERAAKWAKSSHTERWEVAILNDDAIVPTGWFEAVSFHMRGLGAAAGCSGGRGRAPILHTEAKPVDLSTRMQGFAFVLAGEKGVRANEQLHWYFTDDHLDWSSRQLGGTVMVPGFHVNHLYPNGQMTPELHAQTGRDAAAFSAYWRSRPW